MKLTEYNWVQSMFEDDPKALEQVEKQFNSSGKFRALLREYAQNELTKLDRLTTLNNMKDCPDRAELVLMASAQREILNNFLELLLDD